MKLPTMSCLFSCLSIPLLNACLGCSSDVQDVQQWERTVRCVLLTTTCETLGISNHIRRGLLLEDNDANIKHSANLDTGSVENDDDDDDDKAIVLQGLPSYPLYKVLSLRLCLMCNRELRKKNKKQTNNVILDTQNDNDNESTPALMLIPAEEFGLQEQPVVPIPKITQLSAKAIRQWFLSAGNQGVLTILGLRFTVGSDPRNLLPPCWTALLQAANQPNKTSSVLSVAARARAKHAHRSTQAGFFGIATGSPTAQNVAALQIIERLLHEAVWINIHTFSGTDGKPALEIRSRQGYGARWVLDFTNPLHPTDIEFRGLLEPQMKDGHIKGWKH